MLAMFLAKKNDDADWLSRWDDPTVSLPDKFPTRIFVWIVDLTAFGFLGPTCAAQSQRTFTAC